MADTTLDHHGAQSTPCPSTKDLLDQVTRELNHFEAKKLPELKAELEAFDKKKGDVVADYEKKYPGLRDKWCVQQQQIEKLYAALKCAFPDWKEIVADCVCKLRHDVYCFEHQIRTRQWCCQGARERARANASSHFDWTKQRLDGLTANAQKIADQITANDKLIKDIQGLLPGTEQETVLYYFWFVLLPAHKKLAPEDISADCKNFAAEETPEKLCHAVWAAGCPAEPGACCLPDGVQLHDPAGHRRAAPWLLPPANYAAALDCAWDDYHKAKDNFAQRDAEYKADPDDLTSLGKKLEDQKKGLEDKIKACLKQSHPKDDCCTAGTAPPAGAGGQTTTPALG